MLLSAQPLGQQNVGKVFEPAPCQLETLGRDVLDRAFLTLGSNVAGWQARKNPLNLSVTVPLIKVYTGTVVTAMGGGCYTPRGAFSDKTEQALAKHLRGEEMKGRRIAVYEKCGPKEGEWCSKFMPFLANAILSCYDEKARKFRVNQRSQIWALRTNRASYYGSFFNMNWGDFVWEYDRMKNVHGQHVESVEKGLPFLVKEDGKGSVEECVEGDEGCVQRVLKGQTLLGWFHAFVQQIKARQGHELPVAAMCRAFDYSEKFLAQFSFASLFWLEDTEAAARGSHRPLCVVDMLCDVWVCCYDRHTLQYEMVFLSTHAWEDFHRGHPLEYLEFTKELPTERAKSKLARKAYWAARKGRFLGMPFVISVDSDLYRSFLEEQGIKQRPLPS